MSIGLGIGITNRRGGGAFKFISTWKTDNVGTSNDNEITLPLESTGTYNFTADWGDGSLDIITVYNQAEVTHTYSSAGTYIVKISGQIEGWRFNSVGDCLKITDISQWGNLIIGNNNSYFYGCSNMDVSATDELDVSGCTTLYYAFQSCSSLTSFVTTNWDVSSVTTFYRMFWSCVLLTHIDVSLWDVSSAINMYGFFASCRVLIHIDVSSWDVGLVTNIDRFFYNADELSASDYAGIKNWTVTSLTIASQFMYLCANSLSTADYDDVLINWEAQSVQDNVSINFNNSKYTAGSAAATARQALIDDHSWTITDGGTA